MNQPQTEQPEETTEAEPPSTGAACFLDQARICGADCMAFLPQKPEGTAFIGAQWAHCHLLVNADRGGRHLVVLADVGAKLVAIARQKEREAKAPGVG